MSELEEFHRQIIADVQGDADALARLNVTAFFEITGEYLTDGEIDSANWAYFEGKAANSTLQVHGYGGDPRDSDGILSLIICDFEISAEVRTVNADHVKRLLKRLVDFLTHARKPSFRSGLEESSAGFGLADMISATWADTDKIKLILVTNAEFRAKSDTVPAGIIDSKPITYSVWDLKRLARYVEQGLTRQNSDIDFAKDFGGPVPVLRASLGEASLETYIAVIPGHQLAAIYDQWGARLLESNVRSFLQARGTVNRGIRDTIANTPEMFLAYNNGLSATATSVHIKEMKSGVEANSSDETTSGLFMTWAENLQIVNGGQTTASIHAARKAAPEQLRQVFVQMKLSIVPTEMSDNVVPLISQYANSQNKVAAADFFANHPFHIRIEGYSRRLLVPAGTDGYRETKWFYERARGQFADERGRRTISERKVFDAEYPRTQFLSKTDLAKYENTWSGFPHEVSKGAQKNFTEFAKAIGDRWGKEGASFDEVWFRRLIAKAIIFRRVENLVSATPWYQGGYRANIVTYSIAKLVHDVGKKGHLVNLDAVWRQQGLPGPLEQALAIAAEEAQSVILSPPSGIRNLSEWAKKQACWKVLSDKALEYPEALEDALVEPDEARSEVKEAKADKTLSRGISAEVRVHQLGAIFWSEAVAWARQNKRLSPTDLGILETCSAIPRKMPSDRQSKFALAILDKLVAGGFRHTSLASDTLEKA